MIDGIAKCIRSTGARARIDALVAHTGAIPGTLRVQNTLGTTAGVGITLILGQARALAIAALCIGTTR